MASCLLSQLAVLLDNCIFVRWKDLNDLHIRFRGWFVIGTLLYVFDYASHAVSSFTFDPFNSSYLMTGAEDGEIRVPFFFSCLQ